FAEAGSDNDDALYAVRDAIVNGLGNELIGSGDDSQVNLFWHIPQGGVGWAVKYFGNGGVDKINRAGETPGDQLASGYMSPFMGSARRAQDSDGARIQHLLKRIGNIAHSCSSSLSLWLFLRSLRSSSSTLRIRLSALGNGPETGGLSGVVLASSSFSSSDSSSSS